MKGIRENCLNCDRFQNFISYDGVTSLRVQMVCYDNDVSHYEKLIFFQKVPFLRKISVVRLVSNRPIKSRLKIMLALSIPFAILSLVCIIALFVVDTKPLYLYLVGALSLMFLYTCLQLHFLDLKKVKIFDVSFDNGTYQNLLNLGYANEHNRVQEVFVHPHRIDNGWKLHIPILSEICQLIRFAIILGKRDYCVMKYISHSIPLSTDCLNQIEQTISEQLRAICTKIESYGLKVYSYDIKKQ